MNDALHKSIDGMKPGDRRFVYEQRVLCVEASESADDFKLRDTRFITVAEKATLLHPNDVANLVIEVVR